MQLERQRQLEKTLPLLGGPKFAGFLVVATTLMVFANGLRGPFVFDDVPELVQNSDIRTLYGCWDTVSRSPDTGLAGRPVACLSFAANYALTGQNVLPFHAVNVIIHTLNALLLFAIVRRTIQCAGSRRTREYSSETPLAACIAMLWAVHPLQTESVTYIVQRIESLAAFWYLLTLYSVIRSWGSAQARWWRCAALGCCAAGLLTKETVVTAPVVILLYDLTFGASAPSMRTRAEKWFYAALFATWAIPAVLISQNPRAGTVGFSGGVSALDYLRTQGGVIVHYLRLCFWPHPLTISYADWEIVRDWSTAAVPGMLILALLGMAAVGLWRKKWWGFAGASFFLLLAPSSSFVPIVTEPAAERRMYLPLAAITAVVVLSVNGFFERILVLGGQRSRYVRWARAAACGVAIAALGARTVARNADYASAELLLTKALADRPGDVLVRAALMQELVDAHRIDDASRLYAEGVALRSGAAILHEGWGQCMMSAGQYDDAAAAFRRALELRSDAYPSLSGLGRALAEQGRWTEAVEVLRRTVAAHPNAYRARSNFGVALAQLGRVDEAIAEFEEAINRKPSFSDARLNLGRLLLQRGETARAIDQLRSAARNEPRDPEIRAALAVALEQGGYREEALREYREAVARDPDNPEVRRRLRALEAGAGGPQP